MAKVTWLGEEQTPDLKETVRFGVTFKKDEAVDFDNPAQLEKLKTNKYFKVEGAPEGGKSETVTPPSQQGAQGPVPKPGEPKK